MSFASCLVDTNVLLRLTRKLDPQHSTAQSAISRLFEQNTSLFYCLQNIAELWNVMTRPIDRNGLGLSTREAEAEVRAIESGMRLLPDTSAVYSAWRNMVVQYGVTGVQVHDARLAATMHAHNIRHILTFNLPDFARFSGVIPVHPGSL